MSSSRENKRSTPLPPPFLSLPRSRSNTTSSVQSINSIATISIAFGTDMGPSEGYNAVAGSSRGAFRGRGKSGDTSRRPSFLSIKGSSSSGPHGGVSRASARGTASRSHSTPLDLKSPGRGQWTETSRSGRSSTTSPLASSTDIARQYDPFEGDIEGLPLGLTPTTMLTPGEQHRSPSEEALLYHLECDTKREGQEELTLRTFSEGNRTVPSVSISANKGDRDRGDELLSIRKPMETMIPRPPDPADGGESGEELSKSLGRRSMDTFRTARATIGFDMEKDKIVGGPQAGVAGDEGTGVDAMVSEEGQDLVVPPDSGSVGKVEVGGPEESPAAAGVIWRLGSWVYESLPSIRGASGVETAATHVNQASSKEPGETADGDGGTGGTIPSHTEAVASVPSETISKPHAAPVLSDNPLQQDPGSTGQGSGWMGSRYLWRGASKDVDPIASSKSDDDAPVKETSVRPVVVAGPSEVLTAGSPVPLVASVGDSLSTGKVRPELPETAGRGGANLGTTTQDKLAEGKSWASRFRSSLVRDPVIDALSRPAEMTDGRMQSATKSLQLPEEGTTRTVNEPLEDGRSSASLDTLNVHDANRTPELASTSAGWWFSRRTSGLSTAVKSPSLVSEAQVGSSSIGAPIEASLAPSLTQGVPQPENGTDSLLPKPTPSRTNRRASVVVRKNQILPSWNSTFQRPPRSMTPTDETHGEKDGLPKLEHDNKSCWKGIRRVVVIGVHGWFPNTHIQKVVGAPRTSGYFCSMMGQAVLAAFEDAHGIGEDQLDKLTYMPLDGEGSIAERVDKLYRACTERSDWVTDLGQADAIFIAAHSQGCIVAAHVTARLIREGYIVTARGRVHSEGSVSASASGISPRPTQSGTRKPPRVALLSMCGVHLGPFWNSATSTVMTPYLWFEHPSARELFDFQESTSLVSDKYQESLRLILDCDVKVILLASLDDQMVPIYSASFSAARHPGILRTLYVDSSISPAHDFILNLIVLGLMMLNAGLDDQGLISHLSEATAGAWRGVGHSNAYEDPGGYDLAVNYLLRTSSPVGGSLVVEPFSARDAKNDYELPWILRGVMDDPQAVELFRAEIKALKDTILTWQPDTRALREIKKRLEPMAGRAAIRLHQQGAQLRSSPSSTSIHSFEGNPGGNLGNGTTNSPAISHVGQSVPSQYVASVVESIAQTGLNKDW